MERHYLEHVKYEQSVNRSPSLYAAAGGGLVGTMFGVVAGCCYFGYGLVTGRDFFENVRATLIGGLSAGGLGGVSLALYYFSQTDPALMLEKVATHKTAIALWSTGSQEVRAQPSRETPQAVIDLANDALKLTPELLIKDLDQEIEHREAFTREPIKKSLMEAARAGITIGYVQFIFLFGYSVGRGNLNPLSALKYASTVGGGLGTFWGALLYAGRKTSLDKHHLVKKAAGNIKNLQAESNVRQILNENGKNYEHTQQILTILYGNS